jgi:hypothetical protein
MDRPEVRPSGRVLASARSASAVAGSPSDDPRVCVSYGHSGGNRSANRSLWTARQSLPPSGALTRLTTPPAMGPGPVSDSSKGAPDDAPYVPSWCYPKGPRICPCGHHQGYHDDNGKCLLTNRCGWAGLPAECRTPDDEMH